MIVLALALGLSCALPQEDEPPLNSPSLCPHCQGEPKALLRSGLVSHGGFPFGRGTTAEIEALVPEATIYWFETEHFELGMATGTYRMLREDVKRLEPELDELRSVLRDVPAKPRQLDPWLRGHLFARRLEAIWDRFVEIMRIDESVFPDGNTPWLLGQPYHGDGPYLGMRAKYEVLVLPDSQSLKRVLLDQTGILQESSHRYHELERGALGAIMHENEEGLRQDGGLHGHIAFHLAINLLDGFEQFAYETPVWIREGLAHFMQREIWPKVNSFDSSEGFQAGTSHREDWVTLVKRLIQQERQPRLAQLVAKTSYSQLALDDHYTSWSMTCFLIEEHGEGYAALNASLHGLKTEDGWPDGGDMREKHRLYFQEHLGMTYAEFDAAWSEWALAQDWSDAKKALEARWRGR